MFIIKNICSFMILHYKFYHKPSYPPVQKWLEISAFIQSKVGRPVTLQCWSTKDLLSMKVNHPGMTVSLGWERVKSKSRKDIHLSGSISANFFFSFGKCPICFLCLNHFAMCLHNTHTVLVPVITLEQTEWCLECDSHLKIHFLSEIIFCNLDI